MLSKGNDLKYEELKTQSYLLPGNNLSINDMRRILQIRIRDIPVRRNFPNAHKSQNCLFKGCTEEETQAHLFNSSCWTKERNITASNSVKYEDIFKDDISKQFEVMSIISEKLSIREKVLRNDGPWDPREEGSQGKRRASCLVIRKARRNNKKHTKKQDQRSVVLTN